MYSEFGLSAGPPSSFWTVLNFYDGSSNLNYQCKAKSVQRQANFSVALGTLVNIVVSANVATITFTANHGYAIGNPIVISGSATTALNGTSPAASVPSATTLTVATSGVSNGTYTDMVVSSTAPRSSDPIWAIQKFTYTSSNLTMTQWAGGEALNAIADNRTSLIYQ